MKQILIILVLVSLALSSRQGNVSMEYQQGKIERYIAAKKQHEEAMRREAILKAIMQIESRGNVNAHNIQEDAVGVLQIRRIMVREINRVLGYQAYTYKDRWDYQKSVEMFTIFQSRYNPTWDAETAARKWNGGGRGMQKQSTVKYWNNVKENLIQFYS